TLQPHDVSKIFSEALPSKFHCAKVHSANSPSHDQYSWTQIGYTFHEAKGVHVLRLLMVGKFNDDFPKSEFSE
ncbi:18892_t:CDS:1, partial [Entrophospora sp. SA101]